MLVCKCAFLSTVRLNLLDVYARQFRNSAMKTLSLISITRSNFSGFPWS